MLRQLGKSNPRVKFTSPLKSQTTRFERDGQLAFSVVKHDAVRQYYLYDRNGQPGAMISQYVQFGGPDEVVQYSLYDPTNDRLVRMTRAGVGNTPFPLYGMWNWVDIVGMGKTILRIRKEIDRPNSAPQLTVFAGDEESVFSEDGWRLEGEPWTMNFRVTGPEGPLVAVQQRPSVLEIEAGHAYREAMALAMVTGMTLATRSTFYYNDEFDDDLDDDGEYDDDDGEYDDDDGEYDDDEDDFEDDADDSNPDYPF